MKTKGTTIKGIQEYLHTKGDEIYQKWFNSLSEETKKIYSSTIITANMYPLDILKEASEKAAQVLNMDLNKFSYEDAKYSVDAAMNSFLKILTSVSSIKFIFNRTNTFIKTYYDFGDSRVLKVTNTNANFLLFDIPLNYEFVIWRMFGWLSKVIEIKAKQLISEKLTMLEPANNASRAQFDFEYKL